MMEPPVELRTINVGCFGGGTGLPSLLGGLKRNPWLTVNAVVTMFDSGGSSGQLRDQLGVLPPGDVLKCALALARNEREARRVLLSRLPMLQDTRPSAMARRNAGNSSTRRAMQRAASTQRTLRSQRSTAYASKDENPRSNTAPRLITSSN